MMNVRVESERVKNCLMRGDCQIGSIDIFLFFMIKLLFMHVKETFFL
jgi:hypothetical protein